MLSRLKKLQANKGQFASGGELSKACKSNLELRSEIEALAKFYLSKQVSGCSNCYFDAYFELINLNLEKAMSKDTCNFKLRAGALLHDVVNFDNDLLCSQANITDELAIYHLKTNPKCIKFFEKTPENLEKVISEFKLKGEEKELTEEEKAKLEQERLYQEKAEKELLVVIAEMLKAGTTKTAIREKYEKQNVGTKKITQRMMTDFLNDADVLVTQTHPPTTGSAANASNDEGGNNPE